MHAANGLGSTLDAMRTSLETSLRARAAARPRRPGLSLGRRCRVSCPEVEQAAADAPTTSGRPLEGGVRRGHAGLQQEIELRALLAAAGAAEPAAPDPLAPALAQGPSSAASVGAGRGCNGRAPSARSNEPRLIEMDQRIGSAGSLPLLLDLLRAEGASLDPRGASQAAYQLAKLYRRYCRRAASAAAAAAARSDFVDPCLAIVGAAICRHAAGLDAWGVSISLWAYGILLEGRGSSSGTGGGVTGGGGSSGGGGDAAAEADAPLAALCARGGAALRAFKPIDCACALIGWARLRARGRAHREFVDALISHSLHLLTDTTAGGGRRNSGEGGSANADGGEAPVSGAAAWKPQELANVAWALARVGAAGGDRRALLEALMAAAQRRLDDFNTQELATLVYACARVHYRSPAALSRIANKVARHLDLLAPQDASMLMWGFAKLAFKPGPLLLDRLPAAVAPRLGEFKPQELANLVYAYGVLRHHHPQLMDAAAAAAAPRLADFSAQDITLLIWAHGAVRHAPADPGLLHAACGALLSRNGGGGGGGAGSRGVLPMQAAIVVKGLAKCGCQPPPALMAELGHILLERLGAFKPVEVCHVMWAYARLGFRDVRLVEAAVGQITSLLLHGGPQQRHYPHQQQHAPPGAAAAHHQPHQRAQEPGHAREGGSGRPGPQQQQQHLQQPQQPRQQQHAQPPLSKLTVDTVVWAATQVGFWPQALIDAAEMRGFYVRAAHVRAPPPATAGEAAQQLAEGGEGVGQREAWEAPQQQQQQHQQQQHHQQGAGGGAAASEAELAAEFAAAAAAAATSLGQGIDLACRDPQAQQHQHQQQPHEQLQPPQQQRRPAPAQLSLQLSRMREWRPPRGVARRLQSVGFGDEGMTPLAREPATTPVSGF